jgi:hypothetical protein
MFLIAVVDTAASFVESIGERAVAVGMSDESVHRLTSHPPDYFSMRRSGPTLTSASRVAAFWLAALAMIAIGFAVSYFWSAATMIYFILRRADDGTEFDDVWLGEVEEDDLLPLAGIASGDLPVTERSHHPTIAAGGTEPKKG